MIKSILSASMMALSLTSGAQQKVPDMLLSSYGGGATLVKKGEVVWNYKIAAPCQDAWRLKNGNFLIPSGNKVQIITPEKKVIWEYETKGDKGDKIKSETHTCQPLANGNILVGESGLARLVEVDSKGEVVKMIKLESITQHSHNGTRVVRKTAAGTYVGAFNGDQVCEFDSKGKLLRTVNANTVADQKIGWRHVHSTVVLKNGNWLIGTGYGATFFEITPDNKIVWKVEPSDFPELKLKYAAGIQRMDDGTTVMTAYKSSAYQVFAVDNNKTLLWKWKADPKIEGLNGVTNVQILSTTGTTDPLQQIK